MGNTPTLSPYGTDEDEAYLRKRACPSPATNITKRTAVLSSGSRFSGYGSDGSRPSSVVVTNDLDSSFQGDSPPSPTQQLHKKISTLAFVAHYFIEHLIDPHTDTISSLCLKYDLPNKTTLFDVNASLVTDDEAIFHVHQVYIPVDQSNCNVVKGAHTTYKAQFKDIDISNWELRKKITREDDNSTSSDPQIDSAHSYSDEYVICNDEGLVIKQYYWPNGEDRTITFASITNVESIKLDSLRGTVAISGSMFVERFCYPHPDVVSGVMVHEKGRKLGSFIIAKEPTLLKEVLLHKITQENERSS
jgi:hypothetical protein